MIPVLLYIVTSAIRAHGSGKACGPTLADLVTRKNPAPALSKRAKRLLESAERLIRRVPNVAPWSDLTRDIIALNPGDLWANSYCSGNVSKASFQDGVLSLGIGTVRLAGLAWNERLKVGENARTDPALGHLIGSMLAGVKQQLVQHPDHIQKLVISGNKAESLMIATMEEMGFEPTKDPLFGWTNYTLSIPLRTSVPQEAEKPPAPTARSPIIISR